MRTTTYIALLLCVSHIVGGNVNQATLNQAKTSTSSSFALSATAMVNKERTVPTNPSNIASRTQRPIMPWLEQGVHHKVQGEPGTSDIFVSYGKATWLISATAAIFAAVSYYLKRHNVPESHPFVQFGMDSYQMLSTAGATGPSESAKGLVAGDLIVIFGASGGLGQLIVKKLATRGKYKVRAVARNVSKAKELFQGYDIEIVQGATTDVPSLPAAVDGAAAVIVTTGTTAFPTKRWFDGDTPQAIDYEGVQNVVNAVGSSLKRFLLVTSIGLERKDQMPFKFLNAFGVIDQKRKGELAVIDGAKAKGYNYQLVRPGRLVGGPYTNPDLAKLMQADISDDCQDVDILKGDAGLNDCGRWSCSEAILEMLENATAVNVALSVCNKKGKVPASSEEWQEMINRAVA